MAEASRDFSDVARLPAPADNAAVATERLEAGTRVARNGEAFTISHTVLEGHRFLTEPLAEGEELLSWGLPFGRATKSIAPGDYACNEKILTALAEREVDFQLPDRPNFRDAELLTYTLDGENFQPGEQVPLYSSPATFKGYRRGGSRGVGTRNYVVLIGATSRTGGFVKALEHRLQNAADDHPEIDGIVAVAHTEGGEEEAPNNLDLLLRTLSGFIVNPNVGAALVVDEPFGTVTNDAIRGYLEKNGYPLRDVPHEFMTLGRSFGLDLKAAGETVRGLLDGVGSARRTEEPLSELKVALQCGGSDAFSGISANPLAGRVAKEIVRNGGTAVLAETDELIGAESYALANVRDLAVAERFLLMVERFKRRVGWHGHTAEGNPSGGNNYRGLYNISIKSIGAATKRDPEVRLDEAIEYAERFDRSGYLFMDSPGNDLESVAGQVAAGCNLVFFTTGNGSVTNFPFVPTIKIVTTTGRYRMLRAEMDVNAGAYLDGEPLGSVGARMFGLTLRAASGEKTAGERAGHSQVSIWRNWRQTGPVDLPAIQNTPEPDGEPLPLIVEAPTSDKAFDALKTERGYVADQVGLIMPTSLCSGQIAVRIADGLNARDFDRDRLSRFVALPHTEGCGNSGGASEKLYSRTVLGHLANPIVRFGLLLEHGCEKTHNDYFHARLREAGLSPDDFGWASVQLDGGIDAVVGKVAGWFDGRLDRATELASEPVGLEHLRLGLDAGGPLPDEAARAFAALSATVVASGGTVVVPERSPLLTSGVYLESTVGRAHNTLSYGEAARKDGFHVMESPTGDPLEAATGLAATGVGVMLTHVSGRPLPAHRMVPLLQVSSDGRTIAKYGADLDLTGDPDLRAEKVLDLLLRVASRGYTPKLLGQGNVGFQFTRGLLGVSM
ncbi:UxaA family hydrolase [Rubrobacter indicoceani]|uniref:UxaA family hydrolase n=1 Tax=Rubrobacter indicoceani TaxID=2051957 RepID=UPI000E5B1BE8|nr:UxaA family hydrolase [Rubrobacter indicoceani]